MVFALFAVAIMATSDVHCALVDRETAASNSVIGYIPSLWRQTSHADFLQGTAAGTQVSDDSDSVHLRAHYTDPGVYVLVGGRSTAFYRYNITSGIWSEMAPIPAALADGAAMVYDGSAQVYALAGGSSSALFRYDVLANTWSLFATVPANVGKGGDITWDGTYLYVMGGASGRQVWRLDVASLTWLQITTVPGATGTGASVLYNKGYLYVTKGDGTKTFWRYDLRSGRWAAMANAGGKIGAGSDLIAGPRGALYVLQGNNGRQLASYDATVNAWSRLSNLPNAVSYGGGLTYGGSDIIYSINGNDQRYFHSFNRTLNSWTRLAMVPSAVSDGGCLVYVPPVPIDFPPSGTLTSATFDSGQAGTRYVHAFWDRTVQPETLVKIEVRASDSLSEGSPAAEWRSLGTGTSGAMDDLTGRYVQWRATLTTSDASMTPELQEVRIYYYHV